MYIIKRFAVIFLLFSVCLPINAEIWIRDDYTFGAENLSYNKASVAFPLSKAVAMGVDFAFYSDHSTADTIYSLRLPFYFNLKNMNFTFRPFYYPSLGDNKAWAGGFYSLASLPLFQTYDGISGQLDFSFAGSMQHAQFIYGASSETKDVPSLAYQVAYKHNFDNMFMFTASGAMFQYLDSVSKSFSPLTVMDNSEMVLWNVISAYRKLPQLVGGVEIFRTTDEAAHASIFVSYYYIKLMQDYTPVNSLSAGFKMDIFDNTMWFVNYNIQLVGSSKSEFYRIGLRMGFE